MINRDKYLKFLVRKNFQFSCTFCENGVLETVDETFKTESTPTSEYVYEMTGQIEYLKTKFITFLKCRNKNCGEIFTATGIASSSERIDSCGEDCEYYCQNPHLYIDHAYEIKNIDPAIDIFSISNELPDDIQNSLSESFSLFWAHPSSAGNEIRKILEILMDELKIRSGGTNKKGNDYDLDLHARIEEFGRIKDEKYSGLSMKLLAIKWLGNAGSHGNELSKEDILDAYEVLEYVLGEIFVRPQHVSNIVKKANKLNKTFNPKSNK